MNASAKTALVGGEEVALGEVALTLETGGGAAESAPDALPYGDYLVREAEAPEGYPGTDAEVPFSIEKDGEMVELTGERAVANQVKRGDLELVKVSDGDLSRMAGVPFRITSATTGESHVVVTDANGYASTAASWNPHTASTNANDQAAEGSWDASAGVWFGASGPDDSKGALPYDTYEVEELPCGANGGKQLLGPIEVRVYDADGELVEEWVSGEEPHELTLLPGTYTLHEELAPEGYELAEDAPFTVEETADVQVVTMADEALPGTAPGTTPGGLPQTGDWSWLVPAACAAGAAACVGGAIALGSRRRAKAAPAAPGPHRPGAHVRGGKRWRP